MSQQEGWRIWPTFCAATRDMSNDPETPAGLRALGRVLNHVLAGERDPDLSALPAELAEKVREMLAVLESDESSTVK